MLLLFIHFPLSYTQQQGLSKSLSTSNINQTAALISFTMHSTILLSILACGQAFANPVDHADGVDTTLSKRMEPAQSEGLKWLHGSTTSHHLSARATSAGPPSTITSFPSTSDAVGTTLEKRHWHKAKTTTEQSPEDAAASYEDNRWGRAAMSTPVLPPILSARDAAAAPSVVTFGGLTGGSVDEFKNTYPPNKRSAAPSVVTFGGMAGGSVDEFKNIYPPAKRSAEAAAVSAPTDRPCEHNNDGHRELTDDDSGIGGNLEG